MNIGLKFRDALFGRLGQTVREELDQLVASIVQHWLVGHTVTGGHSNAIGANPGDPVGDKYLNDAMEWITINFVAEDESATISGAWTFTTLPVLGSLTGYIKGTSGALSAVATVPNADLDDMAAYTIKMRNNAASGDPQDVKISALTTEGAPAAGDYLLMEESGGALRKVDWSSLPGGGGAGEANTASNVGTAGVGVFKQKTGIDLEFKKINAGSAKITVTDDTGNDEVDVDLGSVAADDLSDVATSWTSVAHAALTFSASGSMTWTVAAGDLSYCKYCVIGKILIFKFAINASTVGGTASNGLRIGLPSGLTLGGNDTAMTTIYTQDSYTTRGMGLGIARVSGNYIELFTMNGANWDLTTDTTGVIGVLIGELA